MQKKRKNKEKREKIIAYTVSHHPMAARQAGTLALPCAETLWIRIPSDPLSATRTGEKKKGRKDNKWSFLSAPWVYSQVTLINTQNARWRCASMAPVNAPLLMDISHYVCVCILRFLPMLMTSIFIFYFLLVLLYGLIKIDFPMRGCTGKLRHLLYLCTLLRLNGSYWIFNSQEVFHHVRGGNNGLNRIL